MSGEEEAPPPPSQQPGLLTRILSLSFMDAGGNDDDNDNDSTDSNSHAHNNTNIEPDSGALAADAASTSAAGVVSVRSDIKRKSVKGAAFPPPLDDEMMNLSQSRDANAVANAADAAAARHYAEDICSEESFSSSVTGGIFILKYDVERQRYKEKMKTKKEKGNGASRGETLRGSGFFFPFSALLFRSRQPFIDLLCDSFRAFPLALSLTLPFSSLLLSFLSSSSPFPSPSPSFSLLSTTSLSPSLPPRPETTIKM